MRRRKPGGPRLYSNAGQMQSKIDQYFDSCHEREKIPTVSGLCYHLGFTSSTALKHYRHRCKARSLFVRTVKMALLRVEAVKNQALLDGELPAGRLRGLCFDLRCNHGMRDKK